MYQFSTQYLFVPLRETVRSSSEKNAQWAEEIGEDEHHGNFHDDRLPASNVCANG